MPKLTTEHYGTGDLSWLGSTHGITNARTVSLDPKKFTKADHYPEGYLRSGQPVTIGENGLAGPYTPGENAGDFHGFVLTDQVIEEDFGNIAVPVLDHGRVVVDRLPISGFTAPDPANDKTSFVYV